MPPAILIVAKIGERSEQPRGNFRVGSQTQPLLIKAYKGLCDQVSRISGVLHVAPGKREKRFFPARNQLI